MRLDLDCVREILLCVEENTGLRKYCFFYDVGLEEARAFLGTQSEIPEYQVSLMKRFENDKLIYHVNYCIEAGLITPYDGRTGYDFTISDLTPLGHEFLANIRSSGNWAKTKEIGSKVGAFGLNMASKIAEGVVTALVKQQLGLL